MLPYVFRGHLRSVTKGRGQCPALGAVLPIPGRLRPGSFFGVQGCRNGVEVARPVDPQRGYIPWTFRGSIPIIVGVSISSNVVRG